MTTVTTGLSDFLEVTAITQALRCDADHERATEGARPDKIRRGKQPRLPGVGVGGPWVCGRKEQDRRAAHQRPGFSPCYVFLEPLAFISIFDRSWKEERKVDHLEYEDHEKIRMRTRNSIENKNIIIRISS